MDVLELPRPVINFLRTMAKEGCRYVLSWDIFGGSDTVTLTLTWKLTEEVSPLSISKSPSQIYDNLHVRQNDSMSSARRSRRDENQSTLAVFRSARGKSLEGKNLPSDQQIACRPQQLSSSESSSILNRQHQQSDPVYVNLCNIQYGTCPSPLSSTHTHQRRVKEQSVTPTLRRMKPISPILKNGSSRVQPTNPMFVLNDDPWVKRFEGLFDENLNEPDDDIESTSGKVKFKATPDYF